MGTVACKPFQNFQAVDLGRKSNDETSRLLLQDEDMTLIGYVVHDDMRIVVDLLNNQDDEDDEDDKDKEDEDYNEEDDGN
ncbi:hypothetical protein LINPERHAP2_LOCUS35727 [Linum perenne]